MQLGANAALRIACLRLEFTPRRATHGYQRRRLDMQDKVVMGDQKDGLRGLTRFSDNEGDIIWPAWRAELKQRVAFEFGKIGNQIIEGEVKESDADERVVTVLSQSP